MKVVIKPSKAKGKKFTAIFSKDGKKIKTTHFGAKGMSDFTKHNNEDSLSRYILWNKKTISSSIKDYKRRFNLS
jgi:hypothetical protein